MRQTRATKALVALVTPLMLGSMFIAMVPVAGEVPEVDQHCYSIEVEYDPAYPNAQINHLRVVIIKPGQYPGDPTGGISVEKNVGETGVVEGCLEPEWNFGTPLPDRQPVSIRLEWQATFMQTATCVVDVNVDYYSTERRIAGSRQIDGSISRPTWHVKPICAMIVGDLGYDGPLGGTGALTMLAAWNPTQVYDGLGNPLNPNRWKVPNADVAGASANLEVWYNSPNMDRRSPPVGALWDVYLDYEFTASYGGGGAGQWSWAQQSDTKTATDHYQIPEVVYDPGLIATLSSPYGVMQCTPQPLKPCVGLAKPADVENQIVVEMKSTSSTKQTDNLGVVTWIHQNTWEDETNAAGQVAMRWCKNACP